MRGSRITLVPFLILVACDTVKETGRTRILLTSEQEEVQMGLQAYGEETKKYRVITGTKDAAMVARVAGRIAKAAEAGGYHYQWEMKLLDAPKEVNAWCLPGGKMAVYTGILPVTQNEDALAIVVGHEVAHATARHGGERMTQTLEVQGVAALIDASLSLAKVSDGVKGGTMTAFGLGANIGFLLPFSRDHESEADEIGLRFAVRAGYDPYEAPKLWERMAKLGSGGPAFLSTHPDPGDRAERLRQMIPRILQEEGRAKDIKK